MGNRQSATIEKSARKAEKSSVKSALRTLTLFEAFTRHQHPLSLSELARELNIPISSCHALVGTLQSEGYLYSLGERRQFYPTRRLLEITNAIFQHDPALELLAPHLESLRDQSGETVILGRRQDLAVVYLDVIDGTQTIRYSAKAGDRKPLHSSAIGKAMLGQLNDDDVKATIMLMKRPQVTPNTLTDPERLFQDIKQARKLGCFVTRGENVADVWAIATAVHVASDILGIAIAGPMHRMENQLTAHADILSTCCDEIEAGFDPVTTSG